MVTRRVAIAVVLIVVAAVSGFATGQAEGSGASSGPAFSAPGELPIVTEPVTLRALVPQRLAVVPDYATNLTTLKLEELTGVTVVFDVAPDYTQARTVAVASGDLPDFMIGSSIPSAEIMRNGPNGIYVALNDLIDAHAPNIQRAFAELPWLQEIQTAPDGNMYGLGQINDDLHGKYGTKTWINQTWLDALGLDMPTTTDEFYEALVAFKTRDPNGNGLADEIPYSGATPNSNIPGNLLNAFLHINRSMNGLYLDGGRVQVAYTQPEYRDALAYHRRLYAEGLIDPAAFTQTAQQLTQLGENPGVPILGAAESLYWQGFTVNGGPSGRYREYSLLPPLVGPDGVQSSSFRLYKVEKDQFVMTSANQYPEITMKWVDYLHSEEGGYTMSYGPEGIGWRRPAPGAIGLNGLPALFERLSAQETTNINWGFGAGPRFMPSRIRLGEVRAEGEQIWEAAKLMTRLTREVQDKYFGSEPPDDVVMPPIYLTEGQTAEIRIPQTEIVNYVNETSVRFIIGELDITRDWDRYLAELRRLGIDRWLEVYQEAYDAQYRGR